MSTIQVRSDWPLEIIEQPFDDGHSVSLLLLHCYFSDFFLFLLNAVPARMMTAIRSFRVV